jgi:hypothetical protein
LLTTKRQVVTARPPRGGARIVLEASFKALG